MNGVDLGPYTIEQVRAFWDHMVAQNPVDTREPGEQHVLFRTIGMKFAVRADACKGVFPYRQPAPLPVMPPHIAGIASILGRPFSVTDISVFFGRKSDHAGGHMLIIRDEEEETALLVDWVESVAELDLKEMEPPLAKWKGLRTGLVLGAMSHKGEPLIVLDPARCMRAVESE